MTLGASAGTREDPRLDQLLANLPVQPARAGDVRACAHELARWILGAGDHSRGRAARAARLELLVDALDRDAGHGSLRQFLIALRNPESLVRLLAETGIPVETSLPREALRRVLARLLAIDVDSTDFAALFAAARLKPGDESLLDAISERAWETFAPIFAPDPGEVRTAFELVLRRVVGFGLARDLLQMGTHDFDRDSPFITLEHASLSFAQEPASSTRRLAFDAALASCRADVQAMHARTEVRGVSTDLMFRLDQVQALLERLGQVARLLSNEPIGRDFLFVLLRSSSQERSLAVLVNSKLKRLSRKVVEHASHAGEHYVVRNMREYTAMLLSAAGGGALTAFTAMFKFAIAATSLAPGLLGFAYSLNYASSFTMMQFCGLTLASRQPSVTAAALAESLELEDGIEREVELIAGITRAQAASAAGNVLVALPTAMLIDRVVQAVRGVPWLTQAESSYALASLLPQHPANILFAALTGVLLWIASLVGGWAANWAVLHSLPLALRESIPLRRAFGARGAARIGRFADRHFGGASGYIALGFMMGFVPVLAPFMGLPISAPHVTLSSAALGFSISADLWADNFDMVSAAWAFLGVLLIGLLNFSVSFALALRLALRAMDLHGQERRQLLRGLFRAGLRDPLRFILPRRA